MRITREWKSKTTSKHFFSCCTSYKRSVHMSRGLDILCICHRLAGRLHECSSRPEKKNTRWLIIKQTHRRYDATNLLNLKSCHVSLVIARNASRFFVVSQYPYSYLQFLSFSLFLSTFLYRSISSRENSQKIAKN